MVRSRGIHLLLAVAAVMMLTFLPAVLSFMSQFSNKDGRNSTPPSPTTASPTSGQIGDADRSRQDVHSHSPGTPPPAQQQFGDSPMSRPRDRVPGERVTSRPMSMISTYQPPLMEVNQDTLPELQPIFTLLNSHGNKLYQEGYFLKLDDQNSQGRPNADRTWTECFAQLVGTILSLWDAAELDAAGQEGEVLPKFINLTDASIKMIEALPTRSNGDQPLQNVLSISTAGKNRYLLHFNSHHSLIQWTAGIRLAMYEHATLQEAYTGALIAGKGRLLNNINLIMERNKAKTEDWVRVRFGAGTPWRRCWCVITPPDEKEYTKLQKEMNRKKSAYDRSRPPVLKGDVNFYETKKVTKKTRPIATLSDAFSAFAIYPQSKPLIDASTLIKVEGTITIHSNPPTSTEGFVFVMPEVHPAVSGFEIMLRWLFPAMDTFGLYGRPGRLIADTTNPASLMFAMPKEKRYTYLEILDVANLILTDGSQNWREKDWRQKLKELTGKRMTAIANGTRVGSRYSSQGSRRNTMRSTYGHSRNRSEFNDGASVKSTPSIRWGKPPADVPFGGLPRTETAPAIVNRMQQGDIAHHRSVSEAQGLDRFQDQHTDSGLDGAPAPPPHATRSRYNNQMSSTPERTSYEEDRAAAPTTPIPELQGLQEPSTPEPVAVPPAFAHRAGTLPPTKPYHSPELRRAKSRMSNATLSQMTGGSEGQGKQEGGSMEASQRVVHSDAKTSRMNANLNVVNEGLVESGTNRPFERPLPPPPPPHFEPVTSQNTQTPPPPYYTSQPVLQPSPSPLMAAIPNSTSHSQISHDAVGVQRIGQPNHVYTSLADSTADSTHLQPRQSIQRKPLPSSSPQDPSRRDTTPSYAGPEDLIDQAAFDRIFSRNTTSYNSASAASSNQAERSTEIQNSLERPRAGVMRTVGTEQPPTNTYFDIPDVNFGPTINYAHLPRDRSSAEQPKSVMTAATPEPVEHHSRSSSRSMVTPEPSPGRTIPWQPAMAAVASNSPDRRAITPEQFVQQRAAAHIPVYAHQRQSSANVLRSGTPTPPLGKASSEYFSHSRRASAELLQRPSSRGTAITLGPSGSGDVSANLSARDQEHLARVTGTPLVNMQGSRPSTPTSGLIGAIEAREREKRHMKQGINSQAVQQAVLQRQQQDQAQQQMAYQAYQAYQPHANPQGAPTGAYPAPDAAYRLQYPDQYGQQLPVSAGAAAFSQGGGWSSAPYRSLEMEGQGQHYPQQGPLSQPQYQQMQGPPRARGQHGYRG
ncbi:MAG: hypothetical protein M1818_008097 [Claussenomyces sp. TS43310]|nr:MAG: hypothetical protein M1818_008097 [Claussenomyces sp. TS43310]